jgi:hypothetical protein
VRAIPKYEEQERKHTENKVRRLMLWLLAIAAFTAVQAGIKAPDTEHLT